MRMLSITERLSIKKPTILSKLFQTDPLIEKTGPISDSPPSSAQIAVQRLQADLAKEI